jgi:PEP-CTERM motif
MSEETFMSLKYYVPVAAAILAWTAFAGSAYADPIIDDINGSLSPYPDLTNALSDLGWVYSPTVSYELSGIYSDFSTGGSSQTVTLTLYAGIPNSGGATVLGTGTFTSGAGDLGVTFGSDISIVAGDTYFIGLSNTEGIGVNMADAAFSVSSSTPAAPGVTYIPSGFYTDDNDGTTTDFATQIPLIDTSCPGGGSCDNAFAAPILNFYGEIPGTSSVPEPGSLGLSMTGIAVLLFALRAKRRHAASRRDL